MAKSVEARGRGARLARRDEGAYCSYVTEEQRSQAGCIGRENDRLSHSRALSDSPRYRSEVETQHACAGTPKPSRSQGGSAPCRLLPPSAPRASAAQQTEKAQERQ